ncbi:MAG: fasciclin domain-containing protein [Candidatus Aminicenantes bacterium]
MRSILNTILELGQFKTLRKAIESIGLKNVLEGSGPYTLFAPTDEAFACLYADILDVLFRDAIKLSDVLTYHVIPERMTIEDALRRKSIKTANGQTLEFSQNEDVIRANQANIIEKDIVCSNGIVHIIDAVLMPREYCTKVQLQ